MQPRPWRETVRPWVPRAIVSMAGAPLLVVGRPVGPGPGQVHPTGGWPRRCVSLQPALDEMTSARTKTAQRRSAAMTRSNSSQSSWLPPAARKTDRMVSGTSSPRSSAVVGPDQAHRARDGGPLPAVLEHERRPTRGPEQVELAGAAAHHGGDAGRPVDRVVDDAGAHDRGVDGPVRPADGEDGEVMVGRGQPLDVLEICHGQSSLASRSPVAQLVPRRRCSSPAEPPAALLDRARRPRPGPRGAARTPSLSMS